MFNAKQGSILKINGISVPVIVVSKDFFNTSGQAIVCPIYKDIAPGPLHIELDAAPVKGVVLCEQVKYVDLRRRGFTKVTDAYSYDIMNISDAIMGIFDYQ